MTFESDKKSILEKADKSQKGSIDSHILSLCSLINSSENYYTTSSCAGRSVLITIADSGKKNDSKWLYVEHELAELEKIKQALTTATEGEVWFRYEPFILHVACKTTEHAIELIKITKALGLKRSGIISLSSKNTVEVIGSENIATPIMKNKVELVSEEFINVLIISANKKQEKNWNNIKRLESELKTKL